MHSCQRIATALPTLGLLITLGACSQRVGTIDAIPVVHRVPDYIDDAAMLEEIESVGTQMIEAGDPPPGAVLQRQLRERRRAAIPAPDLFTLAVEPFARVESARAATLVICELYLCDSCEERHAAPASGFVISPDGLAVTNYHVLQSDQDAPIVARTWDGRIVPVIEVLAANEADDVALIQLGGDATFTALPVAREARIGERVHTITHPDGRFFSYTEGTISRFHLNPHEDGARRVQITADYARGSSGGPIFNDAGQVVGMVVSTSSVYYDEEHGRQRDLQMVFKDCVPYQSILDLFAEPALEHGDPPHSTPHLR